VGIAEAAAAADRTVAVAAPRTGVEVTPEVAEDRTATKKTEQNPEPAPKWSGLFLLEDPDE